MGRWSGLPVPLRLNRRPPGLCNGLSVSIAARGAAVVPQWCPSVAAGLTDGGLLEEFEIPHGAAGVGDFLARIEDRAKN